MTTMLALVTMIGMFICCTLSEVQSELSSWTEELPADDILVQMSTRNSTGNQDMKTDKVATWAELTFDVDGTGTDGREGLEDKSSSETSGQSFEPASNNVNIGKMSLSC
jgi:hypothetical protein